MRSLRLVFILFLVLLKLITQISSFQMLPIASGKVWTRNILKPTFPEHRSRDMALWGDAKEKKPKAAKSKSKGSSASSSAASSAPPPVSSPAKKQKGGGGADSSAAGKGAKTVKDGKEKEVKQRHVRSRTMEDDMARWERANQVKIKVVRKKVKDAEKSKLKNLPRKLRRHLKSCTVETFAKMIYNPLYDNFLKTRASENMHRILMKKVRRRARELLVDLDPEFGKREFLRPDLSSTFMNNETFSKFNSVVTAAGLHELFQERNKTVFAPTNSAMERAFAESKMEQLLESSDTAQTFVKAHVLEGAHFQKKLLEEIAQEVKLVSLAETQLEINSSDENTLTVGEARVVGKMRCLNGHIYLISAPLWKP